MGMDQYFTKTIKGDETSRDIDDITFCHLKNADFIQAFFKREFGNVENLSSTVIESPMLHKLYSAVNIAVMTMDRCPIVDVLFGYNETTMTPVFEIGVRARKVLEAVLPASQYDERYVYKARRLRDALAKVLENYDWENDVITYCVDW